MPVQVLVGKLEEDIAAAELDRIFRQVVGLHDIVRCDPAPPVHDASPHGLIRRARRIPFLRVGDVLPLCLLPLVRRTGVFDLVVIVGALDEPAARRVIAGRGQPERGAVLQIELALHEALAKRRLADDQSPVPVLHRACDDLAGRSGTRVDENDQRHVLEFAGPGRDVLIVEFRSSPLGEDDLAPPRHHLIDELVRLFEVAAGI